jgi:3-oxoacyl-[acyl-carrier protein] reductase
LEQTSRIALVTGSGRGIGRAIALELAEKGHDIVINYSRSSGPAEEVCHLVEGYGRRALSVKADVSDVSSVTNMFKIISEEMGNVDILVNNAGITRDNLLIRMKDEQWEEVLNSNLSSVYYCTREAVRKMVKQKWGRIINLASVVALIGNPGQVNYVASKAGIVGLTKSVAREYASKNITANAIAPGFIETDMTAVLKNDAREALMSQIPAKRAGRPDDIAKLAGFLASDDSEYINGQVIAVDGGMTMC